MSPHEPLARVDGLSVAYSPEGAPALEDVTFELAAGERVGLLGPNGGGKSTLMRALLGELRPLSGAIEARMPCGILPQADRARLDYPVSVLDVAVMGSLSHLPWWRRAGRVERASARKALESVGLAAAAERPFGELSGGQRQRVLLARALVQDARLLLLDEPYSDLDPASAEALSALIDRLAAGGCGVLVATHDVDQARSWDLVLCVNRRQIAFGPPAEALTRPVLEATYGGSIVEVPGAEGGTARGILPSHHHHHDHHA